MVNAEHESKIMAEACATSMPSEASSPTGNGHTSEYYATLSMLLMKPQDLNVEELVKSLHLVMNENMDLKETVVQNNLAMRHQLSLLEQWNLQVENDKENSRSIINNSQIQIRYLENENLLLKKTLTASQSDSQTTKFKAFEATIKSLNEDLEMSQKTLIKSHEDKEILRNIRLKVEGENTVLKCSLSTVNSELARIIMERHEFVNLIRNLKAQKDNSNIEVTLSDKKNASKSTLQDVTDKQNQPDDVEKMMLKNEIIHLTEMISQLSNVSEERKQKSDAGNQQGEIIRLHKLLKETQEKYEHNIYTDQYYQAKIKSINEQHDEATAKLISYEELLSTKNDEILRIKKDLGKTKGQLIEVQSERDIIAVLRAQVEVYQADFRAEREAREALASDREKLRDDMKHLLARNTQLIDELEAYHRRAVTQRGSRGNSEEPKFEATNAELSWEKISILDKKEEKSPMVEEEIDENLLYCPKCNKTFYEIAPLEQHVNKCLDED